MIAGRDPNGCERCDAPRPLDARGLCDSCRKVVDRRELQARVADAREQWAQQDLKHQRQLAFEAEAIAGPEIRADGSDEGGER